MKRTKIPCEVCGQLISLSNMSKHLARHERDKTRVSTHKYALNHDGLFCQFCGKECKNRNSLCNHERLCKLNPNAMEVTGYSAEIKAGRGQGHPAWNKGLTKETDERIAKSAETYKRNVATNGSYWTGKKHSDESKRKIALSMAGNTHGNRSKKGFYKGFYCGSSYELAYVIYNIDHNIPFLRCNKHYEYEYNGSNHLYFPDFELPDGTIIEIKGYHTELVDIKAAAVQDRHIKIMYKEDLEEHLTYVFNKYHVNKDTLYTLFDEKG